ncbi:MAG: MmpS family transport accessory protein [Chloroflexota bacterium]
MFKRLLLLFSFFFLLLTGCEKEVHTIQYEVSGSAADMAINYRNESQGHESYNVLSGWNKQFAAESYYYLSLNVRNRTAAGSVSCRILVDGEILSEATSDGAYKAAHCGGLPVPPTPVPTAN